MRSVRKAVAAGIGILWIIVPWWILSVVVGGRVVPSPEAVVLRFVELAPILIGRHAGASALRVVAALAVSAAVAIPMGLVMGRRRRVDAILSPAAYLLYPIPKIALLPILLILLGTGNATRIAVLVLVLFFQMLLAVRDGARAVDEHYLLSLDSLGGGRLDRLRYVIWPSVVPKLLTTMRIGSATALAVLFFAETFFTTRGLGYFITDAWMQLSYVDMYAGILTMSLLGLLLFLIIDRVERIVTRWRS